MRQKYQGQVVQGPNGNLITISDSHFQGQGYSLYLTSESNVLVKIYEVDKILTNKYIQIEKQSYLIVKSHPYITSTRYGEIQTIPLIMMEKGIVLERMFQKQTQGFNEPQILKILRDLSKAVSYCHSQGVIHRDIRSENIIYSDGKFKIQNFQKATFQVYSKVPIEIIKQIQEDIEMNINSSIKAYEQINLNLGLALNEKVDIFSIGCLLYTMLYNRTFDINLPIFTINVEWSIYSDKLYNLVKILLASNPKDRPSGNLIEQYIETFSSGVSQTQESNINPTRVSLHVSSQNILSSSGNSTPAIARSKSNNSPRSNSPMDNSPKKKISPVRKASVLDVVEVKQSQENRSSLYTQMIKYISRFSNKTEGWIVACVEENEEGPKSKYVRFLIVKAWNKKDKINKFYVTLNQKIMKSAIDNTIVVIKSLMLLHNYFKKGPPEVYQFKQNENDPQEILKKVSTRWKSVLELQSTQKQFKTDSKDKHRSVYLSQLIIKYSTLLEDKVRLGILQAEFIEGNFSLNPFFNSMLKSFKPLKLTLLESLLEYWVSCVSFSSILFKENVLIKIQFTLGLSMIDEIYCLLSSVSHLLFAFKHFTNYVEGAKTIPNLRGFKQQSIIEKITILEENFIWVYNQTVQFFNQCKLSQLFSSISSIIPQLPLSLIDSIKNVQIFQQANKDFNIFDFLNYNKSLDGIRIPFSYGEAVAKIQLENEQIIKLTENQDKFQTIVNRDKTIEIIIKPQTENVDTLQRLKKIDQTHVTQDLNNSSREIQIPSVQEDVINQPDQFNIFNEFSHQTYSQDFDSIDQLNFIEENYKQKNRKIFEFDQAQQPTNTRIEAQQPINTRIEVELNQKQVEQISLKVDQSQQKNSLNIQKIEEVSYKYDINIKKPEQNNRSKIMEEEVSSNDKNHQPTKKATLEQQSKQKVQKKYTAGYQDLSLSEEENEDPPELNKIKSNVEIEKQNQQVTITRDMVEKEDFLVFPGQNLKPQINSQTKDFIADFSNINKPQNRVQSTNNLEFTNNPFANQQFDASPVRREQTSLIFQQQKTNQIKQSLPHGYGLNLLLNNQQKSLPEQQQINLHPYIKNNQSRQQTHFDGNPFKQDVIQAPTQIHLFQQIEKNQNYPIQLPQQQREDPQQVRKIQPLQQSNAFQLYTFITQELQSNANDWIIDANELTLEKQIGTGSSCEVFQGYWRDNEVAIKKMKIKSLSENHMKEFRREITALVKIRPQKNLVALIGIAQKDDELYIVTEICAGGTLFDLLHRKKSLNLPWIVRIRIGLQIAQGMSYLHELVPPIIHRDLKSLNLLLENVYDEHNLQKVMIKIADFGLARAQDDELMMTGVLGTFHWMAPEIFESKPYSIKADVYSFGIVLWEVCTRETPYKSFTNPHAIMKYVTFDQGRPDLSLVQDGCPIIVKHLMMRCWDPEPNNRPGFLEILSILRSLM